MHAITNSGWVEVITGCMFSGKTEEMLRRLRRAEIAGQEVAAFSPAIDDRYGEESLGSHAGSTWRATVVENTVAGVRSIPEHLNGEQVVAIDEANFFPGELVDVCEELAADGRRVVVSGTDQTFRGEPYHPVPELVAVAEYVEKLQAICTQCGEPATRNQRLVDGEPAHYDDPTVVVGAEEAYEARCRNCHEVRRDAPVDAATRER
ncbi:thymidine kinase [Halarchaeum grantii]|uniref:Thymidine kinase n=1 Tax=Halarchaeum grantii TaxID=1193105 RepID=A0A830EZ60_9EURY|nr:thymidine kinase [Halarchaeum grantii]GGL24240.1 thymidine kinase [Halarchaeum grantii]